MARRWSVAGDRTLVGVEHAATELSLAARRRQVLGQFRRGVLDRDAGTVTGYGPPASHHLRWLASANCLLEIDEDVAEVAAGTPVQVWDLT